MKKIFLVACFFLAVFAIHAKAIQEDIDLAEEKSRISYAIGMLMGSNLHSYQLDIDYLSFTEGLRAVMENAPTQISENEAMELVDAAFEKAYEKAAEEQRILQEEFLTNNSVKPGVRVTPSGLQYEILKETDGAKPEPNSVVKVNYVGTLIDGKQFDKSDEEGAFIPLEMVIPGWAEGLQLMTLGSRYRLYLPATLAYGKEGVRGVIPQYATLIFEVELLEIMDSSGFFGEEELEFEF